ncbi:MAG: hypothetical protein HY815_03240 [Candidatus Riflebacteria bacterium]|nr:hypothetical protein [Candidatus Riflebacteria bacterium]
MSATIGAVHARVPTWSEDPDPSKAPDLAKLTRARRPRPETPAVTYG